MPPVVYGLSSGTAAFPSSALMIGAPSVSASCFKLVGRSKRAASGQNGDSFAGIQQIGRAFADRSSGGSWHRIGANIGGVMRNVALATFVFDRSPASWSIDGNGDVRDAAIRQAPSGRPGPRRFPHGSAPMIARVVDGDIHENFVELDVLLGMRVDQIVILQPGDREHRLAVQFGVIQAVQQMNAAGAGSCKADTQLAGVFRIGAGHERGGFFVPHLDESDFVLLVCAGLP